MPCLPRRWPGLKALRDLLFDSGLRTLPLLLAGSTPVPVPDSATRAAPTSVTHTYAALGYSQSQSGSLPLALDHQAQQDDLVMRPEIRTVAPISVLFVRRTGPYDSSADQAFDELCRFAGPRGLLGPAARFIGISHDSPDVTEEAKRRYDACVTVDREVKTEGEVGQKALAGGRYAVFLHLGSYQTLTTTYHEIYESWLPGSGEHLRDEPWFEIYANNPDHTKPEDLLTEIWIPIR
jgi:AraC family transcriptional regulator